MSVREVLSRRLGNAEFVSQMKHYITQHSANARRLFPSVNPATGDLLGELADMGVEETRVAIEQAKAAYPGWKAMAGRERGDILWRWHQLVMVHLDDLATILTMEMGKPLVEARSEISHAAAYIRWFAEEACRIHGELLPSTLGDSRAMLMVQPLGVVGAITPWNFPASMVARKISPALAAGCTVVLKPAEETPLIAAALLGLAMQAGVSNGVANLVSASDGDAVGQELCEHPKVAKVSFTGSTDVGRLLMRRCSNLVKKVSLELGGNAPFIVFDDADVDLAVEGALQAKFRNAGQTCVSANRLYIHSRVHDEFVEKFTKRVQELKVGNGLDPTATIGPLINAKALSKVEHHVADALKKGARILCGGKRKAAEGTFFEPTVLTEINRTMLLSQEETFGPLAPIIRFDDADSVVRDANDSIYGLAAYFYARDISRVWRVAEALEYGMVGINTGRMSSEAAPFGGQKQSGIGREGSRHGLNEYLEMKYVSLGGIGPDIR